MMLDDQVIILRPAYRNPSWLKPYQERLAKANARAAAETKHLKGQVRVVAMNLLASKYLREDQADPLINPQLDTVSHNITSQ